MADVKLTGLSAITPPLDNGSLFLTSSYDGVSAYTSEKLTLTQLRDEVYLMEAEDKLTFDSSGTNKTVISDANSTLIMEINQSAKNGFFMDTDNGSYNSGTMILDDEQFYVQSLDGSAYGCYLNLYSSNFVGKEASFIVRADDSSVSARPLVWSEDNRTAAGGAKSNTNKDAYPIMLSARNATANADITNAVIAGGVGITADKDDYLFSGKHECQLATENFSFEDAGSVSATEQDWIEVSVGGVTGYIRVFATK